MTLYTDSARDWVQLFQRIRTIFVVRINKGLLVVFYCMNST